MIRFNKKIITAYCENVPSFKNVVIMRGEFFLDNPVPYIISNKGRHFYNYTISLFIERARLIDKMYKRRAYF